MQEIYKPSFRLGILGGGQLGRMFIQEAINYNLHVSILDPSSIAPCAEISNEFVCGDFNDYETVLKFGKDKSVLTVEIEHVNVDALFELEKLGVKVFPQPHILKLIKDKGTQKQFYKENGIPTSKFELTNGKDETIIKFSEHSFVQKSRTGGYDGKGVQVIKKGESKNIWDVPSVIEELIEIEKEISIIVARNESGEIKAFPVVELEFNPIANLVEFLFSPADISIELEKKAESIALDLVKKLKIVGLLAVEMFITKKGEILVNEVAPRTHNSGHQSIEGNITSQFEQHLRSICNMPLGDTSIIKPSVMINLLGEPDYAGISKIEGMKEILSSKGTYLHLYGKSQTKPFRKMGHITLIGDDLEKVKQDAKKMNNLVKIKA